MLRRRQFSFGLVTTAIVAACSRRDDPLSNYVQQQEHNLGGRIGFAAVDLNKWQSFSHRADERFAMCSTFKWALAGLILQRVEAGTLTLDQRIEYSQADLVPYAPVVEARLEEGAMSLRDLCAAAVSKSDNVAANLLLRQIGGPEGFTQSIRAFGDTVTRLDRWETELNENAPDDRRDTTTPSAMIDLLGAMLFDGRERLGESARNQLLDWMIDTSTGLERLRAGFAKDWVAGDKTGTSNNGAHNDVAFVFPKGTQNPIVMASYINAPGADGSVVNGVHAELARASVERFGY